MTVKTIYKQIIDRYVFESHIGTVAVLNIEDYWNGGQDWIVKWPTNTLDDDEEREQWTLEDDATDIARKRPEDTCYGYALAQAPETLLERKSHGQADNT